MNELRRLLLIEDEEDDAVLLIRDLRKTGWQPFHRRVETEAELRAALEGESWDIIISDFSLPQFSAPEALRVVQDVGVDIPFIIVSGTIDEELAVASLKAGAADFVSKAHMSRLIPAIERELREAAVRRDRRRAEQELHAQDERLQLLARATHDALWDCDLRTGALWVGGGFEKLFGIDPRHIRTRADLVALVHEEDAQQCERALNLTLRDGGSSCSRAYRLKKADESYADVLDRTHVIRDRHAGPVRIVGAILDVSEQKRIEAQLRHSQKLEAVGLLAGGIAHDFNNLLAVITSYTELIAEQVPGDDPIQQDLREICHASERGAALVRQLLAFSKRQVVAPRVLDLNAVVCGFEKLLQRLLGPDIELSKELATGLWPIEADAGQLEQILMNLAVNARDAMPEGGSLIIRTRNVEDETASDGAPERRVVLAVSDTGTGMDESTRSRIFEPFFTTKGVGQGTGLGLSTVYGIVQQNGGEVRVHSKLGHGSTFEVLWPRAVRRRGAPSSRPPEGVSASSRPSTVLLVEDDGALRAATARALRNAGYTVLEAAGSSDALGFCRARSDIDVLLTDVVMPDSPGPDLAAEIVAQCPKVRVVYMSGAAGHGVSAIPEGATFIQKPFTHGALLDVLSTVTTAGEKLA